MSEKSGVYDHSRKLHLSPDLALPLDAVTQTFAFVARRGAGKTYGASKLAEEMLAAHAQIIVIDPVGVWWGLRLAADGKSKGFNIPVFGGLHGDIPLEAHAGALVADLVVDQTISVVLDVSLFRKNERKRFATDFAEQLFHRKKTKRSALHLFIEEAQVFVPQRALGEEARLLGAFEDLIKQGRSSGIGCTLISQRPQSVNKDALNQTEALVVLQTNGTQERKALKDWVVDQGLKADLINELPGLPIGTAYIWSPQWLKILGKYKIGKKKTFDASATPMLGSRQEPARELAPVDLEKIRLAMKETVANAEKNDPKALRKKIAELEAEVRRLQVQAARPRPAEKQESVRRTEIDPSIIKAVEQAAEKLITLNALLKSHHKIASAKRIVRLGDGVSWVNSKSPSPSGGLKSPSPGGGLKRILIALAQKNGLSARQAGVRAGLSSNSGSFRTYLATARSRGWIAGNRNRLELTDAGIEALGSFDPLPTGRALLDYWIEDLGGGAARILKALAEAYPETLTKEELGQRAEMSDNSGSFRTYLSKLRALELVEGSPELKASEEFFK